MKIVAVISLSLLLSTFCSAVKTITFSSAATATSSHNVTAIFQTSSATSGIISTVAGNKKLNEGSTVDGGAATSRKLFQPYGLSLDKEGNSYIAAYGDNKIFKVTASSGIMTTVAGTGVSGYDGDGGQATLAMLNSPMGVSLDTAGNIYIADLLNYRIRKITVSTGVITTVAGKGSDGIGGPAKDNNLATNTYINPPNDVTVDPSGNIFFASDVQIHKVTASTGIITTIWGPYSDPAIYGANGVALDASGNVYVAGGSLDPCIFKVSASTGKLSVVAGLGPAISLFDRSGYNGDDILATAAKLREPRKVTFDASGNMYISDTGNKRIRKVTAITGIITTVAGSGDVGILPYDGEGGIATMASLYRPEGIAIDTVGNLYFTDSYMGVERKVSYTGTAPSISVTSAPSVKGAPSTPVASTPAASSPSPSYSSTKAPATPSSTGSQSSATTCVAQAFNLTITLLLALLILHLC